jgi:hypothetical protein
MSDSYLRIFPTDPGFIPSEAATRAALGILKPAVPEADGIKTKTYKYPAFIDQGENFEAVICPACRARLDVDSDSDQDPAVVWWHNMADSLTEQNLATLEVTMPCCGATVTFATLTFHWPAGVASFELSIQNPNLCGPIPPEIMQQLEAALGCSLRQIMAHY